MRLLLICFLLPLACNAGEKKPYQKDWGKIQHYQATHWKVKPRTYLLSYPRSGNTLLRYGLEYLTKRATTFSLDEIDYSPEMDNPIAATYPDLRIDLAKPSIIKLHSFSIIPQRHPEDILIFLVRNYKEALTRQFHNADAAYKHITSHADSSYFSDIYVYENWNPEKRFLVYYEDLLSDTSGTLANLLEFLNEDTDLLDEFIRNLDFHKQRALAYYDKNQSIVDIPSQSKGNDLKYHSNQISYSQRMQFDRFVRLNHPVIWKKYLQRYAEVR